MGDEFDEKFKGEYIYKICPLTDDEYMDVKQ